MKTQDIQKPLLAIAAVSLLSFLAGNAVAQDSFTSTAAPPPATIQTAPHLSYGVPQIVQLAQAKVSDSTIITYIQNSGNSYGLDANQIIYLRQQGVSDAVINTMLNQRNSVMTTVAQTASQATTASPQQNYSDPAAQTSTAVAQPTVTYVQTTPTYVPSSTVYIIPDTQTYRYNANYYQPYYYPYYAWPYPAMSLSFGFGRGFHGGGFHGGGWHGGGHGGWHH
jgi:hypothetical protein